MKIKEGILELLVQGIQAANSQSISGTKITLNLIL